MLSKSSQRNGPPMSQEVRHLLQFLDDDTPHIVTVNTIDTRMHELKPVNSEKCVEASIFATRETIHVQHLID